jgi:hypothetical protein
MIGIGIFISIIVGFFYIFTGFLIKKNPSIIAGYDKLEEYQRKIFSDSLQKGLIITGIVTIVGCLVSAFLKWNIGILSFLILPHMVMIIIVLLKRKRTEKKKFTKIMIVFFITLIILIPAFIVISSKEPSILFDPENIKITGLYGETILVKDITDITILKHIPAIQLRTNGFALGTICKGYFLVEGMGRVKLFLNSTSGPYIKLQTVKNKLVIFNFKDAYKTIDIYNKIKGIVKLI